MPLDARKIINSPIGLNLAYLLGKYTPPNLGRRISLFAADRISARKSWKMVRAVRCNQWIAHGEQLDKSTLDKLVVENFRSVAASIFDYYHYFYNPAAALGTIESHPVAVQLVLRKEFEVRGLILTGIHMSNFDMAFHVGGLAGVKALLFTLPELNAAYQKQWELRKKSGLIAVTASKESLRHAVEHLQAGGLVITALDRPDQKSSYHPKFFNRPAAMPVHHIFMALKAHVPIIVVAVLKQSDKKYHFLFSEPIEMQSHPDRREEVVLNAENVLHVAEDFIRNDSTQWAMTFPVWPEAMDQVPD